MYHNASNTVFLRLLLFMIDITDGLSDRPTTMWSFLCNIVLKISGLFVLLPFTAALVSK